jgi:hypothetical protein
VKRISSDADRIHYNMKEENMTKLIKCLVSIGCIFLVISCVQPERVSIHDNDIIGSATIDKDGTINLKLVARTGAIVGHSLQTIKTTDTNYQEIKRHIGDIQVGEDKLVHAWPEKKQNKLRVANIHGHLQTKPAQNPRQY